MKLVKKKTRKAIEKTVRKAMKKHGPALMASLAAGLASSIATLAKTEAPGRPGTSNLGDLVDQARSAVSNGGRNPARGRDSQKKESRPGGAAPTGDDLGFGGRLASGIHGVMRGSKDAAIAFASRSFLNGRLSAIGEVTEITLDTGLRRARLRVALRGEPLPIDVELRESTGSSRRMAATGSGSSRRSLPATG